MGASDIFIPDSLQSVHHDIRRFAISIINEVQGIAVQYHHVDHRQVHGYMLCSLTFVRSRTFMGWFYLREVVVVNYETLTIADVLDEYSDYCWADIAMAYFSHDHFDDIDVITGLT